MLRLGAGRVVVYFRNPRDAAPRTASDTANINPLTSSGMRLKRRRTARRRQIPTNVATAVTLRILRVWHQMFLKMSVRS